MEPSLSLSSSLGKSGQTKTSAPLRLEKISAEAIQLTAENALTLLNLAREKNLSDLEQRIIAFAAASCGLEPSTKTNKFILRNSELFHKEAKALFEGILENNVPYQLDIADLSQLSESIAYVQQNPNFTTLKIISPKQPSKEILDKIASVFPQLTKGTKLSFNNARVGGMMITEFVRKLSPHYPIVKLDLLNTHMSLEVLQILQAQAPLVKSLDVSNNSLSDAHVDALVALIPHLTSLKIGTNHFSKEGTQKIITAVMQNRDFKKLDLSDLHHPIDDGSAQLIATLIESHLSLSELNLDKHRMTPTALEKWIFPALKTDPVLRSLNLSRDAQYSLPEKTASPLLFEALKENEHLQELSLNFWNIKDQEVESFCLLLETNKTLRKLELRGNRALNLKLFAKLKYPHAFQLDVRSGYVSGKEVDEGKRALRQWIANNRDFKVLL